jgi:hypothetical protein
MDMKVNVRFTIVPQGEPTLMRAQYETDTAKWPWRFRAYDDEGKLLAEGLTQTTDAAVAASKELGADEVRIYSRSERGRRTE